MRDHAVALPCGVCNRRQVNLDGVPMKRLALMPAVRLYSQSDTIIVSAPIPSRVRSRSEAVACAPGAASNSDVLLHRNCDRNCYTRWYTMCPYPRGYACYVACVLCRTRSCSNRLQRSPALFTCCKASIRRCSLSTTGPREWPWGGRRRAMQGGRKKNTVRTF